MIDPDSAEALKARNKQADDLIVMLSDFLGEDRPFLIVYADCMNFVSQLSVNTGDEERKNIGRLLLGLDPVASFN